jgi:hypothetical protein
MEYDYISFDKAFEEFLDSAAYDTAENYLLTIVRAAYTAGWKAAGGQYPEDSKK